MEENEEGMNQDLNQLLEEQKQGVEELFPDLTDQGNYSIKNHTETIIIEETKQSKLAVDEIGITSMEFAKEVTLEQEELQRKISDPEGYLNNVKQVRDTYTTEQVRGSSFQNAPRVNSKKDLTKGSSCKTKDGKCSIF